MPQALLLRARVNVSQVHLVELVVSDFVHVRVQVRAGCPSRLGSDPLAVLRLLVLRTDQLGTDLSVLPSRAPPLRLVSNV